MLSATLVPGTWYSITMGARYSAHNTEHAQAVLHSLFLLLDYMLRII